MPESDEEVQSQVEEVFGFKPWLWQIRVVRAVLAGEDVITVAPTGSGKSLTYWIPLLYIKHGITVVVSPLKLLGTQFAEMLGDNRISAISITAANATNELFEVRILIVLFVPFLTTRRQKLACNQYQVIIVSPEILNNDSRFKDLWGTKRFTDNLVNLVLDEVHVVKEWGGTFRSDYLRIGPIRYLLTRKPTVGIHLGTATMPLHRVQELIANLHLRADHTVIFRLSTDRPNIFLSVHKMEHPIGSYHDLAFIIKQHMTGDDPKPPKFFIFLNSRAEAQAGAEFLRKRLAPDLRDKVKWFHSGMTDEFREAKMHALVVGDVYGHAATDAAGMVSFICFHYYSELILLIRVSTFQILH
jgi:superfamily II DNA helicase RecQ